MYFAGQHEAVGEDGNGDRSKQGGRTRYEEDADVGVGDAE